MKKKPAPASHKGKAKATRRLDMSSSLRAGGNVKDVPPPVKDIRKGGGGSSVDVYPAVEYDFSSH